MHSEDYVKHIWEFANILNSDRHVTRLLKSYYRTTCRTVMMSKTPYTGEVCSHCGLFWSENEFDLKLKPLAKSANTSKSKALIGKLIESQSTQSQGLLTRKQKKRAKWLKKRAQSQLEILCKFCGHKTKVYLEKPKRVKLETSNEGKKAVKVDELVKAGKKKKRKDKTAGLKIKTNMKPNTEKSKSKLKKSLKSITQSKNSKLPKIQQQNKLLKLAELLKKQNKSKNTSENRLKALME